ncbi:PrgH/EprH family type III secretion apparatus protein [Stenotrophomonas sp.]|uniref:PrgH/EprH family type III secretion apparatus protein n=1 Tax=Stenotrophomonas sp. TaxID=69392 RepID=UPI002FC5ED07
MAFAYKLKLLSGALDGVEFTLHAGDTVFTVGRARELHEGTLSSTASLADNVFFIPDEQHEGAFALRVCDEAGATSLAMRVRARGASQWEPQRLPLNSVIEVLGLVLAVRREDEAWAADVLDHRLPVAVAPPGHAIVSPLARPRARRHGLLLVVAALLLVGAGAGWWWFDAHRPATQVRAVEAALARSPHDYAVVHDADGRIHAFADSAAAVSWGQRASQRANRPHDRYHERRVEAARLGALLDSAGIAYAILRLRDPSRPEIVLIAGSGDPAALRRRASAVLQPQMPYAATLDVRLTSDAQLLAIARTELRARGISTRVVPQGSRASVVNDVFLDDAALNAMAAYRHEFSRQWGERRIRIRIRLWDDLLQGRSYQYSNDQLLSVGEGRWEFSNAGNN